jgi:hypothetical protein
MYPRTYFTPQNGYNPRHGARGIKPAVTGYKYSVDDVWGAAVAAQRVNGEYVKEDQYSYDLTTNERTLTKKRNRDIMMDFLSVPNTITDEDRNVGRECRKYLQNDLTFRALKGQLSAFDASVSKVVAVEDEFDSAQHRLELAVVACLPQSHQRSLVRQSVQDRVQSADGGLVGNIGDKVSLTAEVVSANYSQTYGIFWVTAITADNQAVFFSNKEKFDTGTWLTIRGTVKAHRDGKTQINRVKVL